MIITLNETSKWISTNKRTSAEKPISIRLAEELTPIMEFSTTHQREYFRPKFEAQFKYQVDCDKDKFDRICKKPNGDKWVMYPEMLSSKDYSKYIKDPFNKDTTNECLRKTWPHSKVVGTKGDHSLPPYGIPFENLKSDVDKLKNKCIVLMQDTTMHV
jgi:hypothetical protein